MASILMPFPFGPASRSDYRLACGLALSLLAHLLLIAGVRPMTAVYAPPAALQVEIRHIAPMPDASLAVPAPSNHSAAAGPMPVPTEAHATEPAPQNTAAAPNAGLDLRVIPDPYYTSREVDVRAEPLNDVDLVYPQLAYQNRIKGKITLRILINERGGIDQVSVLESEPRGVFEEATLDASRSLQFSPALRFGHRVKSQKIIEVAFDPYESINIP